MTNKLEIVDDPNDATEIDYIVCAVLTRPMRFPDNIIDLCSKCREAIQHRPHIPKGIPLVCTVCCVPDAKERAAEGDLHMVMTTKTAKEVGDYIRKKTAN